MRVCSRAPCLDAAPSHLSHESTAGGLHPCRVLLPSRIKPGAAPALGRHLNIQGTGTEQLLMGARAGAVVVLNYYLVLAGVSCLDAGDISTWEWSKLCMMAPTLFTDKAWTEVIDTLTVAAIRFELLSTAHRGQVGQRLAWSHAWQVVGTVE